ncbi:MAG: thioesterase family protein [Thermoanaerobaculia bacterium]
MAFRTPLHVRFGDLDPAGIVYYPRFMHFCHVAMEEFFHDAIGTDYPTLLRDHGIGFPVVHLATDYHRPLRYGDNLEIEVSLPKLGRSSVTWCYRFLHSGVERPAAESRIVTVCVAMDTFEKAPIPDWLAVLLRAHVSD